MRRIIAVLCLVSGCAAATSEAPPDGLLSAFQMVSDSVAHLRDVGASESEAVDELGRLRAQLREKLVHGNAEIGQDAVCTLPKLAGKVDAVQILADVVVEGNLQGREDEFRDALAEQIEKLASYSGDCVQRLSRTN